MKQLVLKTKSLYCMLHRQALASKTLPDLIQNVLEQIIQISNFIKAGVWFFELREEVKAFCELQNKTEYRFWLDDEDWILICDIFEPLNKFNLQMQGRNTNIIKFVDALKAFTSKLSNGKQKIRIQNYSMFEKLDILLDNRENKLTVQIENGILKYLSTNKSEFERYFPEITNDELKFVRNLFRFFLEKLSDECQNKFLELVIVSLIRQAYHEKLLAQFWIEMKDFYLKTTEKALRRLILYASKYLCETGFFTLLQIKTKQINRLDVEDDLHTVLCLKLHAFSSSLMINKHKFCID